MKKQNKEVIEIKNGSYSSFDSSKKPIVTKD